MTKRILISAGESSGDLHASNLIKELKNINPDIEFFGIGCDKMESLGVHMLERMDSLSVVGVWEAFLKLKFIKSLLLKFKEEVKKSDADLAILIDYPGFNLMLAEMLKKENIPCVYYITPQVWAWGAWRIKTIKNCIKKAITILEFEEDFFKQRGIDATFVGHPLLDDNYNPVPTKQAKKNLDINPDKFVVSLVPGSRPLEVKRILPLMLETASILKKKKDIEFILSQSPNVDEEIYDSLLENINIKRVKNGIYECLDASDFVFTASGTVTLQIARAAKPMLITYVTSIFTAILGRMFIKIPYVGLVNIIAKKNIVPEMLQWDAKPKILSAKILDIISSEDKMNAMKEELIKVRDSLGEKGASKRAAQIISALL